MFTTRMDTIRVVKRNGEVKTLSRHTKTTGLHCAVFGARGWIGQQVCAELRRAGHQVSEITAPRADNTGAVRTLLTAMKPDRVVCLVGRTHGPGFSTIDYLEQPGKLVENVQDNLYAPVSLALLCKDLGIHMTYMGTGCIFEYAAGTIAGTGATESDEPNFFGSAYSIVKGYTDRLMHLLEGTVLNVRIRMPIVAEHHPRNFITKITSYDRICSIPNSMTVLPTLLPLLVSMVERSETGTINLTNPGVISHNEILDMYRDLVDPTFTWRNFTVEEQNAILASRRSNNMLDTTRLQSLFPEVPTIQEAVRACLVKMGHAAANADKTTPTQ